MVGFCFDPINKYLLCFLNGSLTSKLFFHRDFEEDDSAIGYQNWSSELAGKGIWWITPKEIFISHPEGMFNRRNWYLDNTLNHGIVFSFGNRVKRRQTEYLKLFLVSKIEGIKKPRFLNSGERITQWVWGLGFAVRTDVECYHLLRGFEKWLNLFEPEFPQLQHEDNNA